MRKRDRRSMHTVGVIKDALIERMQTRAYSDLSVAELCRAAQISRGTFYLHFQNIAEVLDAVLDDILGELNNPYGAAENGCRLPLCRLIREHGAYRRILTDGALTAQIVDRLIALHEAEFLAQMRPRTRLCDAQLRALFCFQLNGCFAVSKRNLHLNAEEWCAVRAAIDGFIRAGAAEGGK